MAAERGGLGLYQLSSAKLKSAQLSSAGGCSARLWKGGVPGEGKERSKGMASKRKRSRRSQVAYKLEVLVNSEQGQYEKLYEIVRPLT